MWNTTRDTFSKPARNGFQNIPPLMGLESLLECVFYRYITPTALGHNSNAVHRAYAKRALMKLRPLEECEKLAVLKTRPTV